MIYLEVFLYSRVSVLWQKRHLPSVSLLYPRRRGKTNTYQYLGPSAFQLVHLVVLCGVNSLVLFALFALLVRSLWSLAVNTWTIEGWEIERHHTLLRRARVLGGYLDGPDGVKVRIEHQEFPWDIGIWANICQGMGTANPIAWFWPLARSLSVDIALSFEHNEIDGKRDPF